jgi:hypothetical protein
LYLGQSTNQWIPRHCFTATSCFADINRFTHSVTDSQSDSMTGEIGVQITAVEATASLQIMRVNGGLYVDFTGTSGRSSPFITRATFRTG